MPRNYRLDSLRGIASLSVLFHHCIHSSNSSLAAKILNVPLSSVEGGDLVGRALLSIFAGGVAVNFFFILSGSVLMASLQRETRFDIATVVRFTGRRLLRIYPAVIMMVLTFGLLSWLLPIRSVGFSFAQIVNNSLLLDNSVNGGTWTLQSEMLMVPVILFVAFGWSYLGNMATLMFLFWSVSCLFFGAPFAPALLNVAIPSFALGMVIATAMTDIGKVPSWSIYIALLAVIVVRFTFPLSDIRALILLLAFSFFIVSVVFHSSGEGTVLDYPVLTFLGRISYGLYLIHPIVITALLPLFRGVLSRNWMAEHYAISGLFLGLIVALITIPLSVFCEVYIERPFIRLGQVLFSKEARVSPTALQVG